MQNIDERAIEQVVESNCQYLPEAMRGQIQNLLTAGFVEGQVIDELEVLLQGHGFLNSHGTTAVPV